MVDSAKKKKPGARSVRGESDGSVRPEAMEAQQPDEGGDDEAPEALVEGERSYEACRAEAEAIDGRDVVSFKGSSVLAMHNARRGVEAVMAERGWFEGDKEAPKVSFVKVAATTDAAKALAFATRRAEQVVVKRSDLRARLVQASRIRRTLLRACDALVDAGALDAGEVAAIREGRGWFDTVQDCIDLAALLRRNGAKIRGKTAVTAAQINEAATLGSELLAVLRPTGAKASGAKADALSAALDMRNRMAMVLARRYELVERAAGWRWGRELGEHVPALQSRTRVIAPREEPPTPA